MSEWFRRVARATSDACGTWQAFILNTALVLLWLACGWPLHWSDSWQLVANTITTIVTYLLLFLVMNTQNRDTAQINIKLDALIAQSHASNFIIAVDKMTEVEIAELRRALDSIGERNG